MLCQERVVAPAASLVQNFPEQGLSVIVCQEEPANSDFVAYMQKVGQHLQSRARHAQRSITLWKSDMISYLVSHFALFTPQRSHEALSVVQRCKLRVGKASAGSKHN